MDTVIATLQECNLSASQFIISILRCQKYHRHHLAEDLLVHSDEIIEALIKHPSRQDNKSQPTANHDALRQQYITEIKLISSEEVGWHFGPSHATTQQLEEFSIEEMGTEMQSRAPALWDLLGLLLGADSSSSFEDVKNADGDIMMGSLQRTSSEVYDEEDDYWGDVDDLDLDAHTTTKQTMRRSAVIMIKCVVILGILMQSTNRRSNALQSILGIFLQSTHTPQKVIDTLACIGISISTDSINAAIRSLSTESQNTLQTLGKSLLASYAYDNFDVDLKSQVPLAEKSNDSLKHLTSGLLFPLQHGVTADDLKCSEELWRQSALNSHVPLSTLPPKRSWKDLLRIHPESKDNSTPQLSRRDQFNARMFLLDLCEHGPEYFRQFQSEIPKLDAVEEIPLVKTSITAARAMDINNSTVSGNIHAVVELLAQGGVHDPTDTNIPDNPNISQYIILIHVEATPWNRFQHVVFIPGLFHLKMACADAIWRTFLQPLAAREDETSLMRDVTQLQPKETGIYCSKPGFRQMHQLIGHAGICWRLDCWRVHVAGMDPSYTSLDAFAASKPDLEKLKSTANEIALNWVANHKLLRTRRKTREQRDMQYENALLLNKYFLLYEELSYSMNHRDIGRVETSIVAWIPILKATGKHKYATHMMNFLINTHFVFPAGLKHAVRYHILVNPTGKPMKWRAVDWCVELNNLFTKVKNGGTGSNHTIERIFIESPLVQAYRNTQAIVQKKFLHAHLTTDHAAPNMIKSFQGLSNKMVAQSPHTVVLGRKMRCEIPDLVDKGREMMEKAAWGEGNNESNAEMEV
ncbi:uncharacterized protein F5147DRAFT_766804 [Suillus discolor]|uniref:DUF6589 domain-containing protein n=1 Tax=Suillus discolor TaxID=1912936 RepID=A0A9P7FPB1_9AGAM|nr:uncharacterized protein F5147DRAFT_766804 [Suillus discolor]KAG2120928.1 hypothetical protein F5147DRAFT_766804 [Suillus discolor]